MEVIIFETNNWKVVLSENQYYLARSIVVYKDQGFRYLEIKND